jgi:hypothetical protein
MPEGLLSAIHLVLQTRELGIARLNATYPNALRAATNGTIRRHGRNWHIEGMADSGNRAPGRFMESQPD